MDKIKLKTMDKEDRAEIATIKNDIEWMKNDMQKCENHLSEIKAILIDPEKGLSMKVNKNTEFRRTTSKALWGVYGIIIALVGKMFWPK